MKRFVKVVLLVLLLGFVVIQAVPVRRDNPPVRAPLVAPAEVQAILRRSCYDCHSNETKWPWYAYVAPVSWLVAYDVEEGREHLNFSEWGEYASTKRVSKASSAIEEIEEGEMPLPKYVRIHGDAAVKPEDLAVLRKWADDVE